MEKCAICGKPAKYISYKFISPLCEDCAKKEAKRLGELRGLTDVDLDDYYTEPCIEMENVVKSFVATQIKG